MSRFFNAVFPRIGGKAYFDLILKFNPQKGEESAGINTPEQN